MASNSSQLLAFTRFEPKTGKRFPPEIVKQLKDKAAESAKKLEYTSAIKYITEVMIGCRHLCIF